MKKLIILALLSVSTLFASNIQINDAYVRATPPGLPNTAAFMTVVNNSSQDKTIVKVSSSIAKAVELHTHDMSNGMMRMYQVPKVVLAKNAKTLFEPSGYHVMFIGLLNPLKIGETVTFTFTFKNGDTQTVTAPVKSVMSGMNHNKMDHSKMNHMNHNN